MGDVDRSPDVMFYACRVISSAWPFWNVFPGMCGSVFKRWIQPTWLAGYFNFYTVFGLFTPFLEIRSMKILPSSLLLLAVLSMSTLGCGQPAADAPPATEAPAATEGAEGAGEGSGSAEKEAPAEGAEGAEAGSE